MPHPLRSIRLLALVAALAGAAACARVGGPVPGAPPHHRERGFANPDPGDAPAPAWARIRFFAGRVLASTFAPRTIDLPRVANDGSTLRGNRSEATITWVGHATLLIQLDGVNVLTDPTWSDRASPVSFAGPRRFSAPGLAVEDLPPVHLVLISHDHYDHLDVATVVRLAREHHPRFLVPLGLKAWFAALGIEQVEELDWWEARTVRGIAVTCVPAQHFSGRSPWDRDRRLWSGWVLAGSKRLFFGGDTARSRAHREIGKRLGPFDVAAVSIGAYLPAEIMRPYHTTPEESLALVEDVRGRALVPIHWGTFDLAEEPLDDPPRRLQAEARRRGLGPERVWLLRHGETRTW